MENNTTVANFNVTFGKDEEPLLNYFDSIIYPAFTNETAVKRKENEYFLQNIELKKLDNTFYKNAQNDKIEDLILTGILIKKTTLEVKSEFDEFGKLINTDKQIPSAPYSFFTIFLRNHRMILVKNQKGSPDLITFSSVIKEIIGEYIKSVSDNENKLPYARVEVVGVPNKIGVKEALKSVSKIRKLEFKFFPLNNDIDFSNAFGSVSIDTRKKIGSKTGRIIFGTPSDITGVEEILSDLHGVVAPEIHVVYKKGGKGKITDKEMSENFNLRLPLLNNEEQIKFEHINDQLDDIEEIKYTSDENMKLYKTYLLK